MARLQAIPWLSCKSILEDIPAHLDGDCLCIIPQGEFVHWLASLFVIFENPSARVSAR